MEQVRCIKCRAFVDYGPTTRRSLQCRCQEDDPKKDPRPVAKQSINWESDEIVHNPVPGLGYRLGTGFAMMNQRDEYL